MKKFISIFAFVFLLMSNVVSAAYFTDVDDDNIYAESINWLVENGVVWGYYDGSYLPYSYVSRVEFLKMLYETVGLTGVGEGDVLSFSDINEDAWYIKYLEEAYATGVVDGYPDGTFRPDDQINFAEAMKIVANAFFDVDGLYGDGSDYDYCLQDFSDDSDVDTSEWYWSYVYVVDELCIISDFNSVSSSSGFHPQYSVSRGDMADLLYRAKSVVDESDESPFYLKYEDGMEPDSSLSYNEFSFFELDVGDEVGDLTVAGINLFYTDMDLSPYNFYATFDGELTLTGTLYKLDAFDIPFYYLTDFVDDSLFKIPALATLDQGSDAVLYFDEDEVDTSMDYSNGVEMTVTVDSLKIVGYVETTAWDTADIVSID